MKPRTWKIRSKDNDRPLAEVVASILRAPRSQAIVAIHRGSVRIDGKVCRHPSRSVRPGEQVSLAAERPGKDEPAAKRSPRRPTPRESKVKLRVVYQDDAIVVVDKPAGVTTVRHSDELNEAGSKAKFLPATLIDLLPSVVKGPTQGRFRLRAVHRLDRETSGLVVVARTPEAERNLGKQFRDHSIERRYLALVRGPARDETIETNLVRDRGDGRRGSGPEGQKAITHVRVVEPIRAAAVVECRLETGRTHQVRIHLGERGSPLCGERVYDRPLNGSPIPDPSGAERPMLHAEFLEVAHPVTGRRIGWHAPPPADFQECRTRLAGV